MTATAGQARPERAGGPGAPVQIVCVGAGPGATMLLERIVANHAERTPELSLHIRLVDPHAPGGGRIWRRDQSPLLKLNSMLRDVAFFTDASCQIDGPVAPGPSLAEWVRGVRAGRFPDPDWADSELRGEIAEIGDDDFPTRRLNNAYLAWAFAETLRRASDTVRVSWQEGTAVSVEGAGRVASDETGTQLVRLDSGEVLQADLVVYALGHNGTEPSDDALRQAAFAQRHRLHYIAPAFTADVDLSAVPAGADVIVRGMGLAAIDLSVRLAEGRGGRFVEGPGGTLTYTPSGEEPTLHFGSRRGVPYRSKITSQVVGEPVRLAYLGPEFHAAVAARTDPLDFERDVWPLIAAELVTGYYRELFTGYPARVVGGWESFAPRLREALETLGGDVPAGAGTDAAGPLARLIRAHVPDPGDRFDLAAFDRPLTFAAEPGDPRQAPRAGSGDAVHERVIAHIVDDLRVRTSPEHSATQALFLTGLYAFLALAEVSPERWNARSRTHALPRRWFSTFSYLASGPPGHRLRELLALADAGVVRFLGGDLVLEHDEARGLFTATGSAVTGVPGPPATARVDAQILIDAWLPEARAAQSDNPLLRQLVRSGRLRELAVTDSVSGAVSTTGQIEVGVDGAVPGSRREFALGPFVAGLTGGAFTRPGINSLPFRTHDRCARAILDAAREVHSERNGVDAWLVPGGARSSGALR
ncbi:Nitrogen regulatory protein PII [Leucobacter sp. 7(1)]|uniref:FAD/NAD(P)-binding protein n=1 Tax=Leucobacter sp. 7(1) TaxID=1255613 RepID=UPI00097EC47B|nr:FAD/NAD(P)-binding protein [Leucobacter sp. 7(1)]SJN13055.1 Nitrogen regulatory protein PII [Leucobacter sp. 7(1)]